MSDREENKAYREENANLKAENARLREAAEKALAEITLAYPGHVGRIADFIRAALQPPALPAGMRDLTADERAALGNLSDLYTTEPTAHDAYVLETVSRYVAETDPPVITLTGKPPAQEKHCDLNAHDVNCDCFDPPAQEKP